MGMQTRVWATSLLLVVPVFAAGCSSDTDDQTQAPATTTTEAPGTSSAVSTTDAPADDAETTSATPELTAEEQDEADIEETLELYTQALNEAIIGEESIEGIYPFARDTAREQWVTQVMAYQAQEVTFSGLSELEVLDISADGDGAEATACVDVSDVEAVDENGNSFIAEGRLDQTLKDFVLERDDAAQLGWYVVEDTNRDEPCDA